MIPEHVRFRTGIATTSRIARLVELLKKRRKLEVRKGFAVDSSIVLLDWVVVVSELLASSDGRGLKL